MTSRHPLLDFLIGLSVLVSSCAVDPRGAAASARTARDGTLLLPKPLKLSRFLPQAGQSCRCS